MNPYLGEYIGTTLLILLGNGVVAGASLKKSGSNGSGSLFIIVGWGLAVALAIYAVGRFSNAHLNPAVTLALALQGKLPANQVLGYIAMQFAGAMTGAMLVWLHYHPHWKETADASTIRGCFSTSPSIRSTLANLFSEILATAILILGILFIGANKFAEGLNPLVVGGLIMAIGLSLGGTTGFAINPARDLGPRIMHAILPMPGKGDSDWSYAWIPVVGPMAGAWLGSTLYSLLFV